MQIRNTHADGLAQSRTGETSAASQIGGVPGRGRGLGSTSGVDRIEVSDMAERVNRVMERDTAARSEKLARLESSYLSGQYHVDAAALGSAILKDAVQSPDEI